MGSVKIKSLSLLAGTALLLSNCHKPQEAARITNDTNEVPLLPEQVEDFPVSSNDRLATLGKVLFYDKELSLNGNISCGSCHKQENAFTDNLRFSKGTTDRAGDRNTPAIFAKNGRLFWDGRAFSLSDLALRPVRNPIEMGIPNLNALMTRIASIDYYSNLFRLVYPNSRGIDSNMVKGALAEFLRNFDFSNNKFHRSEQGQEALNPSEELGRDLFFGRAQCSQCHHIRPDAFRQSGYGQTDESHNIGLDAEISDRGVGAVTHNTSEDGAFMMPVLLNVELTAPYMHDGRFKTLEEVVEHYNSEIKPNTNLDPRLREFGDPQSPKRLNLSDQEKKGLVDFLKTLTDRSVLTDKRFSDPFVARVR